MDIKTLVNLTSRAWSLKVLALMHDGIAGRQAPLLAAAGASRTAFAQSLQHLETLGLLEKNPGHGHPLRPEFRLTEKGLQIAPLAAQVQTAVSNAEQAALLRRTWSIPVLAVAHRPKFFSEIKRDIDIITDRALSQSLQLLQQHGWVKRQVKVEMHPPRPHYQVINAGAEISATIALEI